MHVPSVVAVSHCSCLLLLGTALGYADSPLSPDFITADGVAVASGPYATIAADFNGDRILDVATASRGTNQASVALGRGDGTFDPAANYTVGDRPYALAAADFNADNDLDLVVANIGEAFVSVLLNLGAGAFGSASNYASGNRTASVAVADLNNDQNVDIVAANQFGNSLTILLGVGDGTFLAGPSTNRPVAGSGPRGVVIADLDGDQIPDVVTADYGSSTISAFKGRGNGEFEHPVAFATSRAPHGIAVGDLNADGKPDIVTPNQGTNTVSVLLNRNGTNFHTATNYFVGRNPYSVDIGDVDGNGTLDIVTALVGEVPLKILLGLGDGRFPNVLPLQATNCATSAVWADLNSDGRLDIVYSDFCLSRAGVFLSQTTPSLQFERRDDSVQISWPNWPRFVLEATEELSGTNAWGEVSQAIDLGSRKTISLGVASGMRFFRLREI